MTKTRRHSTIAAVCALSVLFTSLETAPARAQIGTVVFGVEAQGSDAGTLTLAVEAALTGGTRQASHDPLLDTGPGDAVLLQYAATRADAIALTLRTRVAEGGIAIEATAAREIVVRRYALATPETLPTSARDTARLAIDALIDILTNGAERAAGPPRVAIAVDDAALRAIVQPALEALASQSGAIVIPQPMVAAARAFLPASGDPGQNTTRLREVLDADRVWLAFADASGTHLFAIDASGPQTREVPAGATASDVATAAAALPAPARRTALRVASPIATPATVVSGSTPVVAGPTDAAAPTVIHRPLASTGDDYTFETVGELMLGGAIGFAEHGNPLFGGIITGNLPLAPIQNREGFAMPFNLHLTGAVLTSSSGGADITYLPLLNAGLGIGIQTDPFWIHFYGGVGMVAPLVQVMGHTNYDVIGLGVFGTRFGFPIAPWSLRRDEPDLVSVCAGLDIYFNDSTWSGLGMVGICL